jgi:glutamate/tyrosine decarboxylase-like PLP-dependent enzyme
MKALLSSASKRAIRYLEGLRERRVFPSGDTRQRLAELEFAFPQEPTSPVRVLELLDEIGSPATVASAGGRYFGFVTGGSLPAALAASWLAAAWDQNGTYTVMSPVASKLEKVALDWLLEALGLPAGTGVGFVTGATMANFTALAAARHAVLEKLGWDVESLGLFGAPAIKVVVGEEVHVSVLKALSMLGLGRERVTRVPVNDQGRIRAEALPDLDEATIVCAQAGNVNSGAFDPHAEICDAARRSGAWTHVDGAFGLWALASPGRAPLTKGIPEADSWAADAHKWLNVPYDSGLAFCREPEFMRAAMSVSAAYLGQDQGREPGHYTPELSRRARGIEVWAALYSLGRSGLAELVERDCRLAVRFADGVRALGFQVLNEVVLNQVLVSFGDSERTAGMVTTLQEEGTFWAGATVWQGHTAMRISVSSWATTEEDIDRSLEAVERVKKRFTRDERG